MQDKYRITAEYRGRIATIENRIHFFYAKKHELVNNLKKVHFAYKEGRISNKSYLTYIKNPAIQVWINYYESKINKLHNKAKDYISKIKEIRERKKTNKGAFVGLIALIVALVISSLALSGQISITGFAPLNVSSPITSEAIINKYYAIEMSDNLTYIEFENVTQLGINDVNATDNYNSAGGNTSLWITLNIDANVNVDFCINSSSPLISGGDTILQSNITWSDSNTSNMTVPTGPAGSTPLTAAYAAGTTNIAPGNKNFYRFWVDIPHNAKSGNYSNTIEFKAIETGAGC